MIQLPRHNCSTTPPLLFRVRRHVSPAHGRIGQQLLKQANADIVDAATQSPTRSSGGSTLLLLRRCLTVTLTTCLCVLVAKQRRTSDRATDRDGETKENNRKRKKESKKPKTENEFHACLRLQLATASPLCQCGGAVVVARRSRPKRTYGETGPLEEAPADNPTPALLGCGVYI